MKLLNLTSFSLLGTDMYAKKMFINADHIVSISTDGETTKIYTTTGTHILPGDQTKPITYQLTGRDHV